MKPWIRLNNGTMVRIPEIAAYWIKCTNTDHWIYEVKVVLIGGAEIFASLGNSVTREQAEAVVAHIETSLEKYWTEWRGEDWSKSI